MCSKKEINFLKDEPIFYAKGKRNYFLDLLADVKRHSLVERNYLILTCLLK